MRPKPIHSVEWATVWLVVVSILIGMGLMLLYHRQTWWVIVGVCFLFLALICCWIDLKAAVLERLVIAICQSREKGRIQGIDQSFDGLVEMLQKRFPDTDFNVLKSATKEGTRK